jgi:hypothetical protein
MLVLFGSTAKGSEAGSNLSTSYTNGGCTTAVGCNDRHVFGSLTGQDVDATFEVRVARPWVAQFWAENNECFRLTATDFESEVNGLRMILIAPDGLVIRRTGGAGVPESEIVVADPSSAGRTGFWTVIVTAVAGAAAETEFGFSFGRYFTSNTLNCSGDPNTYWVR